MTDTKALGPTARLFVLSAPSGAGKTSLKDNLIKAFPQLQYSISATTRSPRKREVDGDHYFFKTKAEFENMIQDGDLVEFNQVHGNYYGTPKASIESFLARGLSVILDLDVYGKINFDRVYPDAVGILILPPGMGELEARLRGRNTDSDEVIALRLKNASEEIAFAQDKGKYEYKVINDKFNDTLEALKKIVITETHL
jgi:guanylate kinase